MKNKRKRAKLDELQEMTGDEADWLKREQFNELIELTT